MGGRTIIPRSMRRSMTAVMGSTLSISPVRLTDRMTRSHWACGTSELKHSGLPAPAPVHTSSRAPRIAAGAHVMCQDACHGVVRNSQQN